MAIEYISAGTLSQASNPTPGLPAGYQVGDLFILFAGGSKTSPPTISSGLWTTEVSTQTSGSSDTSATVFYRYATSLSESAPTVTDGNSGAYAQILCYRGVFTSGSFAINNTVNSGSGGTATTDSITTDRTDSWVITYITNDPKNSTWTTPTGTTFRINNPTAGGSICGFIVADEIQSTIGPSTVRSSTMSGSVSVNWIATAVSLRPDTINKGMFFITP
jgi:hypothetical protein